MRSFFLLLALLVTLAVPSQAASLQVGGTFGIEENVPVQGSLALETGGIRLWGAAGDNKLYSFGGDILHRESNGLYAGLGAVIDYSPEMSYSYSSSDTTFASRPHDNGNHYGDKKHPRSGRTRTVVSGNVTTVTLAEEFEAKLGIVTGWSAVQGPFIENRLVINTYGDISARATVGLRF